MGPKIGLLASAAIVALLAQNANSVSVKKADTVSVNLLHINDIHAHFEQINVNTGRCHQDQVNKL